MKHLFLLLWMVIVNPQSGYDFGIFYKNDLKELNDDHGHPGNNDNLKYFRQFAVIQLPGYKKSSFKKDNFKIQKWVSKTKNIKSITKAVTFVNTKENGDVQFTAFRFVMRNNKTFTYITVLNQGLMDYSINGKTFHILYESMLLGVDETYFDTKQKILKIFAEN